MNRLAEFQEKAQKIKNKVVSAMAYPVIVLIIAMLIMLFLLAFIVPKFEQIFKDMLGGKPLPALTQWVIGSSNFVQTCSYRRTLVSSIVGVVWASSSVGKMISATPGGRELHRQDEAANCRSSATSPRKSAISRFQPHARHAGDQRRARSCRR